MQHSSLPDSVGIDVSKDTLVVALRFQEREEHFTVPNTRNGITVLHRRLRKCHCSLIMESTGRYHLLAAFSLMEKGYDVRVVNPIKAKSYITASIRKKKTDKTDATALARMGVIDQKLPDRFASSKNDIHIRQKMGLLSGLERQLQSLKLTLQNYLECQEILGIETSDVEQALLQIAKHLKQQKDLLENEIEALIALNVDRTSRRGLAVTVPGISPFVASLLCQFLRTDCVSAKQWIAFIGLDLSSNESGKWQGRKKLSKRGNAYLRKRLFGAAWGAVMHHEAFRSYYDTLKADGRKHKEALVIIARKLLRILFAVLKQRKPFSFDSCIFA